jgi:hypothetical protein
VVHVGLEADDRLPLGDPGSRYRQTSHWSAARYHLRALSTFDDLIAVKPFLGLHIVRIFDLHRIDDAFSLPTHDQPMTIRSLKSIGVYRFHLALFVDECRWGLAPQPYVNERSGFRKARSRDQSVEDVDVIPDIWRLYKKS